MAVSAVYASVTPVRNDNSNLGPVQEFKNISATTSGFTLYGGRYAIAVVGSSFGTVTLEVLGPDGTTYLSINQVYEKSDGTGGTAVTHPLGVFSANSVQILDLPRGTYKFALA